MRRRSPPFPTTSSAPTKRARSPPAIRSASCTSRAPRSTCRRTTDPYAPQVYAEGARELRRAARARRRSSSRTRRRSISTGCAWATHEQTGVAGCFSVDEYERDVIKKHERTRRDKEDDRTRHIDRAARADRRRVPDLPGVARRSMRSRGGSPPTRRSSTSPRRTACSTRSGRAERGRHAAAGRRVRADPGALHRRRPSSRRQRGARARASCGSAATAADAEHVHRRRVSRQPDADPARTTAW